MEIVLVSGTPENTRRQTNVGLMLGHRLRRWPNIKPTLVWRLVFAGTLELTCRSAAQTWGCRVTRGQLSGHDLCSGWSQAPRIPACRKTSTSFSCARFSWRIRNQPEQRKMMRCFKREETNTVFVGGTSFNCIISDHPLTAYSDYIRVLCFFISTLHISF